MFEMVQVYTGNHTTAVQKTPRRTPARENIPEAYYPTRSQKPYKKMRTKSAIHITTNLWKFISNLEGTVQELRPKFNSVQKVNTVAALLIDLEQMESGEEE